MPDKTPISVLQAGELTKDMSSLSGKLDTHRGDLAKYKRSVTRLTAALVAVCVMAIVAAVAAYRAREATEATNQSRMDARESACLQANVQIAATRAALTDGVLAIEPDAETPDDLSPEARAFYDAYEARVSRRLPFRDCTPSGIEEFYENPPADPARLP